MASAAANFAKKMQSLKGKVEEHESKIEELQAKIKALEQENLAKDQEITSVTHRNQLLDSDVVKLETNLHEAKESLRKIEEDGQRTEGLQRRLQLLEEEAEEADKTLRETNEKYDSYVGRQDSLVLMNALHRLRQTDVKAGHYERKVQALEAERDNWETKYEEMSKKYSKLQEQLQELEVSMGNM